MPGFMILFGELVDGLGQGNDSETASGGMGKLTSRSGIMIYFATGILILSATQMILFQTFAENLAHKIRIRYFKSCIEKDATWYDENNPSEMAPKIARECSAI